MVKTSWVRLCKGLFACASLAVLSNAAAGLPPGLLDNDHAAVRAVIAVQDQVTADWMQRPGVLGTAVGLDATDTPSLVVYVDRDNQNVGDIVRSFPATERGVGVRVEVTDKFRAMAKPGGGGGGGGVSHTAKQALPIQLGTSGGWAKDLANGYCCGGTLGSLVLIGGRQYILSNYHVFEADKVPGGNNTVATTGDAISQPGLIDVNCNAANGQTVA